MDEPGAFTYMPDAMRLLILLSAFLTALTGAMSGAATAAQPVQASTTVATVKPHVATVAAPDLGVQARLSPGLRVWHVADSGFSRQDGASFGERRRL